MLAACSAEPPVAWADKGVQVAEQQLQGALATGAKKTAEDSAEVVLASVPIQSSLANNEKVIGALLLTTTGLRWQLATEDGRVTPAHHLRLESMGTIAVMDKDFDETVVNLQVRRTDADDFEQWFSVGGQYAGKMRRLADDLMNLQLLAQQGYPTTAATLAALAQAQGRTALDTTAGTLPSELGRDVESELGRTKVNVQQTSNPTYRRDMTDAVVIVSTARIRLNAHHESYQIMLREVSSVTLDNRNSFAYIMTDSDYPLVMLRSDSDVSKGDFAKVVQHVADASALARTSPALTTAGEMHQGIGRPESRPLASGIGDIGGLEEHRLFDVAASVDREDDTETFNDNDGRLIVTNRRVVIRKDYDSVDDAQWHQTTLTDLDTKGKAPSGKVDGSGATIWLTPLGDYRIVARVQGKSLLAGEGLRPFIEQVRGLQSAYTNLWAQSAVTTPPSATPPSATPPPATPPSATPPSATPPSATPPSATPQPQAQTSVASRTGGKDSSSVAMSRDTTKSAGVSRVRR